MGEGTGFNSKIANNISTTYMKQKSFVVIEKDAFQAIYIRPAHTSIYLVSPPKTIGHI